MPKKTKEKKSSLSRKLERHLRQKEYRPLDWKLERAVQEKSRDFPKKQKEKNTISHKPDPKQKIIRINDSLPDAANVENPMLEKSEEEGDFEDWMSNHYETWRTFSSLTNPLISISKWVKMPNQIMNQAWESFLNAGDH